MNCPICEKEVNIVEQIKEANDSYYEDITPPIMLVITCNNCGEQSIMIDFLPMTKDNFEYIETPELGPIKIPKK